MLSLRLVLLNGCRSKLNKALYKVLGISSHVHFVPFSFLACSLLGSQDLVTNGICRIVTKWLLLHIWLK